MSRKVFTAGEVLAAADVNSFLMDQTCMSFAGTAARGSAIPSPVEGMVTYLEDIDDLRTYNGTSWVAPYGLTKITDSSFSAQTSFSVNNVFSSAYRNYKILLNVTAKSGNGAISLRFRTNPTDTDTNYFYGSVLPRTNNTSSNSGSGAGAANRIEFVFSNLSSCASNIDVFGPNIAGDTNIVFTSMGGDFSTYFSTAGGGVQASNAVFDGFTIISDVGNITGTIQVYGYRN
jgi:hypothetical protein